MKQQLMDNVMNIANKVQNNRWLNCISGSFMKVMPALMGGAVFSLIQGLPLGDGYTSFLASSGLSTLLTVAVSFCNLTALFFIFALGYNLGEMKKQNAFQCGAVALLCLLLVTPLGATVMDSTGTPIAVEGVISTTYFGAQGIFTAIFVGLLSVSIYAFGYDHNWKIRMPESVPEMVSKPFEAIVPAFVTAAVFLAIRAGFAATTFGSLQSFIYAMVQTPLVGLGNSFGAMLLCIALTGVLWWLGIHGTVVVMTAMMVLWQEPAIENLNNYMAGLPVENIISLMFYFLIIQFVGGPGCMFGLTVDMALFSKSKQYKTMGKISLVPGVFNIIEPIVFGYPIVLNPIMFIPFVFTPVIFAVIAYVLMQVGIVGIPGLNLAVMTIPGPVAGFILGGGISLGILIIVFCILSCIIYLPFFKLCDMQALKREQDEQRQLDTIVKEE